MTLIESPYIDLDDPKPGIYFGLPEAVYHSLKCLSATGFKDLAIGAAYFWEKSWMNPNRNDEDKEHFVVGRGYHSRILEGPVAFDNEFAPAFDPAEYKRVITTVDQYKEALDECGAKYTSRAAKPALVELLADAWPDAPTLEYLQAEYADFIGHKQQLAAETISRIKLAAMLIEKNPMLQRHKPFTNGFPEVTIIWREGGLTLRARLDWLSIMDIIDLKTFVNKMKKDLDTAVYNEVVNSKLHVQVAHYHFAVDAAKRHVKDGAVFFCSPEWRARVSDDWLADFAANPEHTFRFIFQQKGSMPVTVPKIMRRKTDVYAEGVQVIKRGVVKFRRAMKRYGADTPWLDLFPWSDFDDAKFPKYLFPMEDPDMEGEDA